MLNFVSERERERITYTHFNIIHCAHFAVFESAIARHAHFYF